MSLTQDIASLVKAAGDLTSEVAGKMAQIDSKVDAATQAVPEAVSAQANVTFYVDINGSDETGDGKSSNPFRTIRHAIYQSAYDARVNIRLSGAEDSQTPHLIDQLIDIGSRYVSIQFYDNHVRLADDLGTVFSGQHGACLNFSDLGGRTQFVHMDTNKVLLSANGQCLLHMGGYSACVFYINDAAKLTLMQTNYSIYPRGVSVISGSRVNMKNADGSAAAVAEVVGVNTNQAGTVFINYWQSSLGSNYKDHSDPARVANLVGSLNVVSI